MDEQANMINILWLSPQAHLHILSFSDKSPHQQAVEDPKIIQAFHQSPSEGLLALVATRDADQLPAVLMFWRDFAARYFKALCHLPVSDARILDPIPAPPDVELEKLLCSLPPMPGAEYCTHAILIHIWQTLDQWTRAHIEAFQNGVQGFIAHHLPLWSQVGRVCFHLAENKRNPDYPFAFLATYAANIGAHGKVQYKPLSQALIQYAGKRNHQALQHLLKPLYEASKRSAWVNQLVEKGDIYHPLAWTIKEAYAFLNDIAKLDESGLVIRLPDWWKKRTRPKVQIKIGEKKTSQFGKEALLDFNLGVALDGEPLTQSELKAIFSAQEGLVSLRGRWVEVDAEKLKQTLDHWEAMKRKAKHEGMSFIEGMRLLAGAESDLSGANNFEDPDKSWAYIEAGRFLKTILKGLKSPASLTQKPVLKLLKADLRPYQHSGVQWLMFLSELGLGACLADDMGLGKTIQVLALLLTRKHRKPALKGPSLLVLPASLLSNWKAELERFAPSLKAIYLHASELSKNTIETIAQNPTQAFKSKDLVLTTYGMLLRQPFLKDCSWDLVILDEAQAIKNPVARQTKAVKDLPCHSRIALTGTPIENRLGDLWSLFDFLCPGLLGSAQRFKRFIKALNQEQHPGYQPLRQLVQPYILRRLKTDKQIISDLPDKTEVARFCGLSKVQAKLYAKAVKNLTTLLHEETAGIKRRGLILSFLMQFKQICNHPSQYLGHPDYLETHSGKFIRLREICEEIASRQEKVLVFTQFREMTSPIADFLSQVFGRSGLILHGGTPIKKRKQHVDLFQDEQGPPFFVLSLKAAGVGLNLTAANHVIHFDRWWNPAVENQATDRAFRIGQHKNVLVHKFVCQGTIEEKIDRLIADKTALADDVLQQGKEPLLTELADEQLLDLVSLDIEKAML